VKICLAASGGGHIRQLLDLRPFWADYDCHFVTEPTPIARGLQTSETVYLVPHFAFGQFRLRSFLSAGRAALRNFAAAWKAVRMERPQLVVSTGAGSVFFTVLIAKLHGARFVLIESFARFETPSLFARLTHHFADAVFVQSERLGAVWPDAEVFDPLVLLGPASGTKEDLGVITVGTVMPFDRLVNGVACLDESEGRPAKLVAQVGEGGARPQGIEARESVEFEEMMALLERAKLLFCHGGTGSLITALRAGCRIVAMPRRADRGEHYDDHQGEIVRAFAARGLIEVAEEADELPQALARALAREPQRATTDPSALIERLRQQVHEWFPRSGTSQRR
jgi:UDP-N-acetylglucosamine--N-acetylmuramyl-(pentapeptide) pyrophosphoryl-undecaprenol N-acetylglucosamine transferase